LLKITGILRFVQRPIVRSSPLKRSGMDHITVFTLKTHHTFLHLVNVHQTAPPLNSKNSHLIAAYLLTSYLSALSWSFTKGAIQVRFTLPTYLLFWV